ncbi:MAG: proton-conducting transporter membrane subunit, partial [Anaerolineae bacterium]|nr:proton-conducting transporter membrane subunit [Anaerolineae bacterium]
MAHHLATNRGKALLQVPGWRWPLAPVIALPVALCAFLLWQAPAALAGAPWTATVDWLPALGLSLHLRLDSLSLTFALLIAGIGALVFAYSLPYMAGERGLGRYYASLTLFMLAMLGLVTAANLLALFVFWELTSISSYLLIGFRHEERESQEAALQALLVTGAGGLALLAGFLLIGQVYGSLSLSAIEGDPRRLLSHPCYGWAVGLILVGAFAKSAQCPFHFWLPRAMVAPTPVSAYLHSATMVKAGIYLLARLSPVLGGSAGWQAALLAVGGLTMLLGAWRALRQHDLKAILAYTTISTLGMMVALLGLGTAEAVQAALATLIGHALYKGALFLIAGAIEHETGTRDVRLLGGLWPHGRALALTAALAALSMAGLPPTFGFLAKELGYASALGWQATRGAAGLLAVVLLAANACNVALALVLGYRVFFGAARSPLPRKPHGASWLLVLAPALLAGLSWLAGIVPDLSGGAVRAAVGLVLPGADAGHLQLW